MFDALLGFLKDKDIKFEENKSFSKLSYMKLGGIARVVCSPSSLGDFTVLISYLQTQGFAYKVVGNMSNILPPDGVYCGVIVRTDSLNRRLIDGEVVTAEAGCRLSRIIWDMSKLGMSGAEELFMIPATLGGAVYNNAGAYGKCISDLLVEAKLYNPATGAIEIYSNVQLQFGYRTSVLKSRKLYLLSAKLKFLPSATLSVTDRIIHFVKARRASQPCEYPSLGSVFKRHSGVSAGYYIDRAGLKGMKEGGAVISEKHAGFIVNKGGATSEEVKKLIRCAKTTVLEHFGIELEEEIEIM